MRRKKWFATPYSPFAKMKYFVLPIERKYNDHISFHIELFELLPISFELSPPPPPPPSKESVIRGNVEIVAWKRRSFYSRRKQRSPCWCARALLQSRGRNTFPLLFIHFLSIYLSFSAYNKRWKGEKRIVWMIKKLHSLTSTHTRARAFSSLPLVAL